MPTPALRLVPNDPPLPAAASTAEQAAWWLARIAQRDGAALEALYACWSGALFGIALKSLPSRSEAEEVLQDTFVRIWKCAGNYHPTGGSAFGWACVLLRGLCLDHRRREGSQKRGGGGRIVPFDPNLHAEPSQPAQVIPADEYARVHQLMNLLEPAERECLKLAVFFEYTQREIAQELATPLGTIKNRLRRAFAKLRPLILRHEL